MKHDAKSVATPDGQHVWYLTSVPATTKARRVANALGPWFERNARELPWRETRDLYAIWVSEVMLQQTRVDTVLAYYEPFLKRFPSVQMLAKASEDEVLEAWSGLGYYRRARFLHRGARFVCEQLGGELPEGAKALQAIPGIGPYTAGALASIGQGRPEPLVDGNVARVSSRLRAVQDPLEQDAKHVEHWAFTRDVLEAGQPRVLAQALMELGALVCTPRKPRCDACPVSKWCAARAQGSELQIPAPKVRAKSPESHYWALLLRHRGRVLLHKRPSEGLLADMWCLPLIERAATSRRLTKRGLQQADATYGLSAQALLSAQPVPQLVHKHVFTHRIWHLHLTQIQLSRRPSGGASVQWAAVRAGERPAGGVATLTNRLLELVDW